MKKIIAIIALLAITGVLVGYITSNSDSEVAEGSANATDHEKDTPKYSKERLEEIFNDETFTSVSDKELHTAIKEGVKQGVIHPSEVVFNSSEFPAEEELTEGGFTDPLFYTSNFELYVAHYKMSEVREDHKHAQDIDHQQALREADERLNKIAYTGEEKAEELEKAKELVKTAIENKVDEEDKIIDEIISLVKELDQHFNVDYYVPYDEFVEQGAA